MLDAARQLVAVWLRVPPEPRPPAGAPGSLVVFRAASGYYTLCVLRWAARQFAAFLGFLVALAFFHGFFEGTFDHRFPRVHLGHWGFWILLFEGLGLLAFLCQLPLTFLVTRLEYELRWYLVTDRSLRIRSGIWTVEELTMTFANIQELTIHQGPLQRLLGIADLKVRSAGGGAIQHEGRVIRETHVGFFHGVDNAEAIRDLILAHQRHLRDAGLGDPDELRHPSPIPSPIHPSTASPTAPTFTPTSNPAATYPPDETLAAAQAVLAEVRAWRRSLDHDHPLDHGTPS